MSHCLVYLSKSLELKQKIAEHKILSEKDLSNYIDIIKEEDLGALRHKHPKLRFYRFDTYEDAARVYYNYVSQQLDPPEFDSLRFKSAILTDVEIINGRIDLIPLDTFTSTRDNKFVAGNVYDLVTYYNYDYNYRVDMIYSEKQVHYQITRNTKYVEPLPHTLSMVALFSTYIKNIHIAVPNPIIGNAFEYGWVREWANTKNTILYKYHWRQVYAATRNSKVTVFYGTPRGIGLEVKALVEDHILSTAGAELVKVNEKAYYTTRDALTTESLSKLRNKYIITELIDFK